MFVAHSLNFIGFTNLHNFIVAKNIGIIFIKTYLFAVSVVISTLFPQAVSTSSQLLPPVIRWTELSETQSAEFFALLFAFSLDGAVLCFVACLWRLRAKNNARTAFSFASLISTAVTCSNP